MLQALSQSLLPPHLFRTKIYSLTDADWTDPPTTHKWAYNHATDAGEQVLVTHRQTPELLLDLLPSDPQFLDLVEASIEVPPLRDHSHGGHNKPIQHQGRQIYLDFDYDRRQIIGYTKRGWQFLEALTINSTEQLTAVMNEATIPEDWSDEAIAYAELDFGWLEPVER